MLAYSQPITPAPITVSVRGNSSNASMSSLAKTHRPSNGMGIASCLAAGRYEYGLSGNCALALSVGKSEAHGVRIDKGTQGHLQFDAIAQELMSHHVDLVGYHRIHAGQQIFHSDLLLDRVRNAVDQMFAITRQVHQRFPQRFAGDGPGVNANATHNLATFGDRDALTEPRRLDGGTMAGGTAP
jgi:hypothetical protein